ncbi:MAG: four helix bundle protein [Salinivirgaceae bacterium]|nr:four helix bundle protein [Salinivirgaceae bacterium]
MNLEDLKVYQLSMVIGDKVWDIVNSWDYFIKDTIGKQIVRSADSIAANISEGFGRYHFKDSKKFLYYSRGSLYETKTWLTKAKNRNLISDKEYQYFESEIKNLGVKLNNYIKSIGNNTSQMS